MWFGVTFAWWLLVTFANGSEQRLGYFDRETCEEARMELGTRADVRSISECHG